MSGSETGCGDGEELGLEAAADAGGLTNFSEEIEGRRESKDTWIRYKVVKHRKDLERATRISRTPLEQLIYHPLSGNTSFYTCHGYVRHVGFEMNWPWLLRIHVTSGQKLQLFGWHVCAGMCMSV